MSRKFFAAVVAAAFVGLSAPTPASAQTFCEQVRYPNKSATQSTEMCRHVQDRIREVFPDSVEDHAISCFIGESSLYKWSHHNYPSQYKGIPQMGDSERDAYGFRWRVLHQVRAAHRLWKARGFQPWYAPAC